MKPVHFALLLTVTAFLPIFIPARAAEPAGYGPAEGSLEPEWHVEVVQQDSVLLLDNGAVQIRREPFILRVRLPEPLTVQLNVSASNVNFRELREGLPEGMNCFSGDCGMAEGFFNEEEDLMLDDSAHHVLYYNGPSDHRWSKVEVSPGHAVFERRVRQLFRRGREFSLKNPRWEKLYLVVLVDFPQAGARFRKIILSFADRRSTSDSGF